MNFIQEIFKTQKEWVEWKSLGEVAEIWTWKSNWNEAIEDWEFPFFVRSKFVKYLNSYEFDEEAIIIPWEWWIWEIFHYINWKYALHQRAYRIHILEKSISTKFVYYFMKNFFKDFIYKMAVNATVTSIRKPMIEKFKIPIPPLEIQKEIVRILDAFTSLQVELQAELQARKKQYNYYLNDLLTPKNLPVWEEDFLWDICNILSGWDVPKENFSKEKTEKFQIPVLSNGIGENSLYGYTNIAKISEPSVTVSARWTIWWASYREESFYPIVRLLVLIPKEKISPKFLYYWMKNYEDKYVLPTAGIPQLTKPEIEKILIKFPKDIKIQEKIVNVLDNFEKICNDLKIGLPAEMEARKKQYEYYREQLLIFNPAEGFTHTHKIWLIKILCYIYDFVEVKLWQIWEFTRWNWLQKSDFAEIWKPCIHYGQIYTFYWNRAEKTKSFCDEKIFEKLKKCQKWDLLIATTSENIEDLWKYLLWEGNEEIWISGDMFSYKTEQNAGFIGYFLRSEKFQNYKNKNFSGTNIKRISKEKLENYSIFLPNLETQNKIVKILNNFDDLIYSLNIWLPAEVEKRQKQYNYYRNLLLDFEEKQS